MEEKIYLVTVVARQIQGEYVFVRQEKGFKQKPSAEKYLESLKNKFVTPQGNPIPQIIETEHGGAECLCEVGIFEIVITD